MAQLTFNIDGVDKISRNLRVFAKKIDLNRDFFKEAIDIIEDFNKKSFEAGGKPKKWTALSSATQKARANRWGYYKKPARSPKILRWTGNLQNNNEKIITQKIGIFRKNAPYAKYHHFGGKNLPVRKPLTLDSLSAAEIVRAFQKELNKKAKISGLQR